MKSWRTSINLDEQTSRIAKKMPNRSAFMRECIRRWHAAQSTTHIHPTETPRCYPHSTRGVCPICWPNGILGQEDWKYYRGMTREGQNMENWANERLIREYAWELPPEIERTRKKGLWERFKALLPPYGRA